jgi:hypothetical protein
MLNRRRFIQATTLALPLAGCGPQAKPGEQQTIGNLTAEQMEAVRKRATDFESLLNNVRKAQVPYAMEPQFYPSLFPTV